MSSKPQAIRKSDIQSISAMKYQGYERSQFTPDRFIQLSVVAKLINKTQFPNFRTILNEVSILLPLKNNEKYLDDDNWVYLSVVLK